MRQEDYNSIMKRAGEALPPRKTEFPKCPGCNESYLGDGKALCVDCAFKGKPHEQILK